MNVETAMTKRETGRQPAAGAFVIPSPAIRNPFQRNNLGGGAFDGHSWTQTLEAQAPEAARFSRADEDARRSGDPEAPQKEQAPVAERQALSGTPRRSCRFDFAWGRLSSRDRKVAATFPAVARATVGNVPARFRLRPPGCAGQVRGRRERRKEATPARKDQAGRRIRRARPSAWQANDAANRRFSAPSKVYGGRLVRSGRWKRGANFC